MPPSSLFSPLLLLLFSLLLLSPPSSADLTIRIAVQNALTSNVNIPKLEQLQSQLSHKYQEPIQIIIEEQPSNPASYASLIRNNYLSTWSYDVYEISSHWASEFAPYFVDLGHVEEFADLCEGPGPGCDYSANALKTFKVGEQPRGALVAVPWYVDVGVLFYRKELIEELVENQKIKAPPYASYEELAEAARVAMLADKSMAGSDLYGFLFEAFPSDSASLVAYEWVYANGGGTVVDHSGTVTLNNEQALDALLNATLWVRTGLSPVSLLGSSAEQVTNLFKACRAPFMRNWMSEFKAATGPQIRCKGTNGTIAMTTLPVSGAANAWGFAISNSCPNKTLAAEIIAFLTSKNEQIERAQTNGYLPTRTSAIESLCGGDAPWHGCFVYSASDIEPPADQTGEAYTNISTYFSTWMSKQYQILPDIVASGGNITEEDYRRLKLRLADNLALAAVDLESILHDAKTGEHCGLSHGVEIVCKPGLSCLNGVCFNVTTVVIGVLVPVLVLILTLLGIIGIMRWRRKKDDLAWSSYAISWSELEVDEKPLGRGTFGVVYKGRYRNTEVAVKKLLYQDENVEKEFRKETQILISLRHPNIILFMGACFEKNQLSMVTEFMPHGTLHNVLHNHKIHLDWGQRVIMLKDICMGMAFLHGADPPIYHRDLKSPNILVDADFRLKVADFGLSGVKDSDKHANNSHEMGLSMEGVNFRGTLYWTAPEVMRDLPYLDKSDVYSFGIICWEILTREKIFPDMHPLSVGYKVMMEGLRPEIPAECPEEYRSIMETCWSEETDVRPTFEELISTIEQISIPYMTKFVTTLKDFKGLQGNQVEAYETDPSIELDEISAEVSPPTGEVTMVITDIGKWEMLWEDNSIPMVKVLNLYSMVLRREMRRREGYEVNTEGRICRVVFQNPLNALEWCLQLQLALLEVDWPKELLEKPYCSESKKGDKLIRRGLLVAMGVCTGLPNITFNPVSNRPEYTGSMVIKTSSVCKLAQYGQVLVDDTTWNKVSKDLGDLAELQPKMTPVGEYTFTGFAAPERIVQVCPASLSLRNFTGVEANQSPSKPHLVRGVSDFQRSAFSDRRDTDPALKIPSRLLQSRKSSTTTSPDSPLLRMRSKRHQSISPDDDEANEGLINNGEQPAAAGEETPESPLKPKHKLSKSDSLTRSWLRRVSRTLSGTWGDEEADSQPLKAATEETGEK